MLGKISITNNKDVVNVDIDGVIGVPEFFQFSSPADKISTYDGFTRKVSEIAEIKGNAVNVNIRSTGGDINDAILIYEALRNLDAEVTTRCYGYVASAATIIAQAAGVGKRQISETSLYLIHRAMLCVEGNVNDFKAAMQTLEASDEVLKAIYTKHVAPEIIEELLSVDNGHGMWLSPQEAVDKGLCDEIITGDVSNISLDPVAWLKLPMPKNIIVPKIESEQKKTILQNFNKCIKNGKI